MLKRRGLSSPSSTLKMCIFNGTPRGLPPLFNDSSMGQQPQFQNQTGGWGPSNQAASVKLEAGPELPFTPL